MPITYLIAAFLLAGMAPASLARAQAFDVASIKPNQTGAKNSGFRRAPAGELNATNVTLKTLIECAYDVRDYQVSGGPNWLDSDRYDILAKSESGDGTAATRLRVQALLSDRFQLTLHRTSRELPVFALLVAKNGPKLRPSKDDRSELVTNGHHLTCQKISVASFARIFLQGQLGRSVLDKTGLEGEFDFTLDWAPDLGERKNSTEVDQLVDGPSLFTALQEQLGLKLEPQKGPVEILVIDHAGRASEN